MKRNRDEADSGNHCRIFGVKREKAASIDAEAIKSYIDEHSFGPKTPALTRKLAADVFRLHYYDKKELMEFCQSVGISTCGLKNELNNRIDVYLRTGRVTQARPQASSGSPDSELGLRLDRTVVNYKSDPVTRAFFQKHIPEFTGFSAFVQKWLKERLAQGDRFTYSDVIEKHIDFLHNKHQAKANGEATVVAHDSCQFNQFYIDYSHDPEAKIHTAKEAWDLVRNSAGEKTYERYQERILEIKSLIATPEEIPQAICK